MLLRGVGISFLPGKANSERLDTNHTKSRRENEFSKLSDLGTLGIYVHILYISNVIHRPNTTNPPYTPPHTPTNPTCPNPLSRPPPPTHVKLGWVWGIGRVGVLGYCTIYTYIGLCEEAASRRVLFLCRLEWRPWIFLNMDLGPNDQMVLEMILISIHMHLCGFDVKGWRGGM